MKAIGQTVKSTARVPSPMQMAMFLLVSCKMVSARGVVRSSMPMAIFTKVNFTKTAAMAMAPFWPPMAIVTLAVGRMAKFQDAARCATRMGRSILAPLWMICLRVWAKLRILMVRPMRAIGKPESLKGPEKRPTPMASSMKAVLKMRKITAMAL